MSVGGPSPPKVIVLSRGRRSQAANIAVAAIVVIATAAQPRAAANQSNGIAKVVKHKTKKRAGSSRPCE